MTDLELIKDLEQHAGFVIDRLTCDGNIYAFAVSLNDAYDAQMLLAHGFKALRMAMLKLNETEKTWHKARESMDKFDVKDWND